jgi:hypothetical protein
VQHRQIRLGDGSILLFPLISKEKGKKERKTKQHPQWEIRESKAFVVHNRHRERDSRDLLLLPFLIPLFVCVTSSVLASFFYSLWDTCFFCVGSVTRKAQSCFLFPSSYGLLLLTLLFSFLTTGWTDGWRNGKGKGKDHLGKSMVLLALSWNIHIVRLFSFESVFWRFLVLLWMDQTE